MRPVDNQGYHVGDDHHEPATTVMSIIAIGEDTSSSRGGEEHGEEREWEDGLPDHRHGLATLHALAYLDELHGEHERQNPSLYPGNGTMAVTSNMPLSACQVSVPP